MEQNLQKGFQKFAVIKILLFQPNYDAHVVHPPLGLGYLASFLRTKKHKVSIFDGTLNNASIDDFVSVIDELHPELVGISVLTRGHNQVKEIIKATRKRFKKLPVVIGGTQVSAAPKEVLVDLGADFGVVGEGETALLELVEMIKKGKKEKRELEKIDGLVFRDDQGKIMVNKPRRLMRDLDSVPFPAWDLMPPKKYRIAPVLEPARAFPVAPIITSRGCPYNCSFCASQVVWGRRIRFRSPQNVLTEIKMLKEQFGVKEIHFADDNFTMDIERAKKICDLMIKKKVGLPWQCPNGVRIDRLTLLLLKKMKKAGCYSVGLGIESGNQEILKKANKNLDLKTVPRVLRDLKKVGIESYGFFILGLPGETKKTMQQTIDFALKHPFDRVWFNIFTPYPGSPVFRDWVKSCDFKTIDWSDHDCSTAVMAVDDLSLEEIEGLQKQALRRFYLRPKTFYKVVSRLGSKEVVSLMMHRFFRKIFRPLFSMAHRLTRGSFFHLRGVHAHTSQVFLSLW